MAFRASLSETSAADITSKQIDGGVNCDRNGESSELRDHCGVVVVVLAKE